MLAEKGPAFGNLMQPLAVHLTALVGRGPDGHPVGVRCCLWPRGACSVQPSVSLGHCHQVAL